MFVRWLRPLPDAIPSRAKDFIGYEIKKNELTKGDDGKAIEQSNTPATTKVRNETGSYKEGIR